MEYFFSEHIFLIFKMINPEFIKYVMEIMFQKYSESNSEVIFKMGKMVFSENDEVQKVICWGCREKQPKMYCLVYGAPNPSIRLKAQTFIPISSGPILEQSNYQWALLQFLLKKGTNAIIFSISILQSKLGKFSCTI